MKDLFLFPKEECKSIIKKFEAQAGVSTLIANEIVKYCKQHKLVESFRSDDNIFYRILQSKHLELTFLNDEELKSAIIKLFMSAELEEEQVNRAVDNLITQLYEEKLIKEIYKIPKDTKKN